MSSQNNLVNSLIDYVKDIKPYHVKLRDFISELQFLDSMMVSFPEDKLEHLLHFTNVWGKDTFGAPEMSFISDGITSSYKIPYCVKPKHDLTKHLTIHDVVFYEYTQPYFHYEIISITETTTGVNANIRVSFDITAELSQLQIPNTLDAYFKDGYENNVVSCTRFGNTYYSNEFEVQDVGIIEMYDMLLSTPLKLWLSVPCFKTEYHVGSSVYLNGNKLTYGNDYIVNESRNYLILLNTILSESDNIDITLFLNDRLFIKQVNPFHFDITGGYDHEVFDFYEYDCDGTAVFENFNYDVSIYEAELPITKTDHFILTIDKSYPSGYSSLVFNEVFPGLVKGKAKLNDVFIYPSEQTGNIWKISAIGNLSCEVQQIAPIISPKQTVTVGQRFDNGKIAFTLDGDWIDYYLIDEDNSYSMFWRDNAELFMDISKNNDVSLHNVGMISETNNFFKFTFNNTPLKNSYIEFRVEQQYQYNPRVHASMMDDFTFFEAQHFTESICATSYASRGFNAYTPCNTIIPSNIDMFPRQEMPEWTNDVLPIITSIRPMIDEIFEEVPYDTELYEFSRIAYGLINIPLFEPTCNLTCCGSVNPEGFEQNPGGFEQNPYDVDLYESSHPECGIVSKYGGCVNPDVFEQNPYDTDLYENSHPECGIFPSITDELIITTVSNTDTEIHSTIILHKDANTYVASKPITHLTLRVSQSKSEIIVMYDGIEYHNYTMTNNGSYIQFVFDEPITPAIFMDVSC